MPKTRKPAFDPKPIAQALDASALAGGPFYLWRMRDGRFVTIMPGKPGWAVLTIDKEAGATSVPRTRAFRLGELDKMREWAASGGSIAREDADKRIRSAAHDLLRACEVALDVFERNRDPELESDEDFYAPGQVPRTLRDAIRKARGKP